MNTNHLQQIIKSLIVFAAIPSILMAQNKETTKNDSLNIYDRIIMERITIVGKPAWESKIPGAATYISFTELKKHNHSDINRVLRNISGINIQEEDGFGLRPNIGMRGTSVDRSSKINLMEDGIPIAPAPYSAPAAYYTPNVNRMSAVEVRKGSSQIKNGPNTTGGSLNMISTPIPNEFSLNAELSGGEFSTSKMYANVGNTYKNFGFMLEGFRMKNNGFKDLDFGGDTGFDIKDFTGKIMFRTNPDAPVFQKLEIKGGYNDELSDETYLGLTREDFKETPFRRYVGSQLDNMDAEHWQLQARHFVWFSDKFNLTTTAYNNNFKRNWFKLDTVNGVAIEDMLDNPDLFQQEIAVTRGADSPDDFLNVRANNREYVSRGVQTALGININSGSFKNEIEVGIRYHFDEMDRFQWEDEFRMENREMVLTTKGIPGTQSNRISTASVWSFYIQNEIEFGKWTFTPGVRFETMDLQQERFTNQDVNRTGEGLTIRENNVDVFVPGAGLTYSVTDNITLLGGVHRGFAPPSPGSPQETKSEESINYELGFRYNNNLIKAELIGFFNDFDNLLGSDIGGGGGGGTSAQFNAGEARVLGLEAAYQMDLSQLINIPVSLPFSANYTYTNAEFQNSFSSTFNPWADVTAGDRIPYLAPHQFNVGLGANYKDFTVDLKGNFNSKMRTIAGRGSIADDTGIDSFFVLDAAANYQISSMFNVFINLRNLTDEVYAVARRPAGLRPGMPRSLMAGVKFSI
ncbi:MAG: TonB-dependent receptor family protein [Balneolaceae bacterium]